MRLPTLQGLELRPLILAESPPLAEALQEQYACWGVTADVAPDTSAAQALMRQSDHNLLLVDEGLAGTESLTAGAGVRRILLSAHATSSTGSDDESADVVLDKPVRPADLFDVSATVCNDIMRYPSARRRLAHSGLQEGRPLRILLAEDNRVNQLVAKAMLFEGGHAIDVGEDGLEAVEMASRRAYDVILMDVQMPGIDGLEATARIRALPGAAGRVPIAAMTANAIKGDDQRYLAAGMDGYVSKPIDPDVLGRVLTRLTGSAVEVSAFAAPPDAAGNTELVHDEVVDALLDDLDSMIGG